MLTSYSLYTQVILILILIDVQYLQNVDFSFEKGLNGQNYSSSDSQHPIKKSLEQTSHFSIIYIICNKYIIIHFINICIYYYLQVYYYLLANI